MTEGRAHFDADIDFVNGGGLRPWLPARRSSPDLKEAEVARILVDTWGSRWSALGLATSRSSKRPTAVRAASSWVSRPATPLVPRAG